VGGTARTEEKKEEVGARPGPRDCELRPGTFLYEREG